MQAGNLTAKDMHALFQPVPFGEYRESAFAQAASRQHAEVGAACCRGMEAAPVRGWVLATNGSAFTS